jgi:hypothetical protein
MWFMALCFETVRKNHRLFPGMARRTVGSASANAVGEPGSPDPISNLGGKLSNTGFPVILRLPHGGYTADPRPSKFTSPVAFLRECSSAMHS